MYYPWTIPAQYVPANATSSKMESRITFDLTFSARKNPPGPPMRIERVEKGILVHSLGGLRLALIREKDATAVGGPMDFFRVYAVAQVALGRDEEVYIPIETVSDLNPVDPYFTRRREVDFVDLVVDQAPTEAIRRSSGGATSMQNHSTPMMEGAIMDQENVDLNDDTGGILNMLMQQFASALEQGQRPFSTILQGGIPVVEVPIPPINERLSFSAAVATGVGAGPLPDVNDASITGDSSLEWTSIFMSDETCTGRLHASVPRKHQIIVMKRGGCSFSEKMHNIPSFAPSSSSLQLVVVVSGYPGNEGDGYLVRPMLDEAQYTAGGVPRFNQIPMIMMEGGAETYDMLARARSVGLRRRYWFESQGLRINNIVVT